MKKIYIVFFSIIFFGCSFDNKSGIWENENKVLKKNNELFREFKKISISTNILEKNINLKKKFEFNLSNPKTNFNWNDYFFKPNNNLNNFKYKNTNQIKYQTKKLTRHEPNSYVLYEKGNLVFNDSKGNIIIYSAANEKIFKYNFYRKKYKNIKKNLNLIIEKNIIFVSDNIGYLYAYDYELNKILWAKNYRSPFRSNLKIVGDKIVAANEKNDLVFYNKTNGNIIKKIPTEESLINNNFRNNLSTDGNSTLFFLNSFGSLYSINTRLLNINWFLNFNSSTELKPNNLFSGVEIVNDKKKLIISSLNSTYIIDVRSGLIEKKFNFSSLFQPIINNNYAFFISKNNFLIAVDLSTKEILYAYNIDEKIANFLDTKKRNAIFFTFRLVNNNILIFLKNSYILNFNIKGEINEIYKLPIKIKTQPIIIENSILYLDQKNKMVVLD